MTGDERDELEQLRASAAKFMTSPLDRVFFELEALIESMDNSDVIRASSFKLLAKAVLELKRGMK